MMIISMVMFMVMLMVMLMVLLMVIWMRLMIMRMMMMIMMTVLMLSTFTVMHRKLRCNCHRSMRAHYDRRPGDASQAAV